MSTSRTADDGQQPSSPAPTIRLVPGEKLGDFELVRPLAAGNKARIFVARDLFLGRLAALKVIPAAVGQSATAVSLDHLHILPVYREQSFAGMTLRAMPFVQGCTLDQLVKHRLSIDPKRWRGRDLLVWIRNQIRQPEREDAAGRSAAGDSEAGSGEPAGRAAADDEAELVAHSDTLQASLLVGQRFVPCMCRLFRGVVRAAAHAHRQGTVHHRIRPSNVLVDANGQTLLMDFRPAWQGSAAGETSLDDLRYLAPEQLAAVTEDLRAAVPSVDFRCDIFSLGVVLYEMLTGRHPWTQTAEGETASQRAAQLLAARWQSVPSLPDDIPGVDQVLRNIVAKCVAPWPDDRYASADALVDDLDRWLSGRAPAHVPDGDLAERGLRRLRRNPGLASAIAVALLIVVLAVGVGWWREAARLEAARAKLDSAKIELDMGRSVAAARDLRDARELIAQRRFLMPAAAIAGGRERLDRRHEELLERLARVTVNEFQQRAHFDRARVFAGARESDRQPFDPLSVYGWEKVLPLAMLSEVHGEQIQQCVTEMLVVRAMEAVRGEDGRTAEDAGGVNSALQANVEPLLSRVPTPYETLVPVKALRDQWTSAEGEYMPTEKIAQWSRDSFSRYLTGLIAMYRGEHKAAIELLADSRESSAETERRSWAHFLTAKCYLQLGQTEEAIADFGISAGLRDAPWPHVQLAEIFAQRGNEQAALAHWEAAVEIAPQFPMLHQQRGAALLELGHPHLAVTSLQRALDLGLSTAELHVLHAKALLADGEEEKARKSLETALKLDPDFQAAREQLERLGESD
ncbi:MAG: serine/threonine-protein kinase [Pirellulales bacterium]